MNRTKKNKEQVAEEPVAKIEPKPERTEVTHARKRPPNIDDLLRVIRGTSNKIEILIDNLDENDNPDILKRNVAVALKHLKSIQEQLLKYSE